MIDSLRPLLYLLGFVANLLFGGRFLLQWIQSEKKQESVATPLFWQLSLIAHCAMCLHAFIQLQFPVCLIQSLSGCIAWRNLNLMGKKIHSLRTTLFIFFSIVIAMTTLFFLQDQVMWMRPPTLPWNGKQATAISLFWHIAGFFGMILFASRYWIQWWLSERHQKSFMGKSFWWISCIGALFSLIYAIRLIDPVNILGFGLGLIPYIRNLMLIRKKEKSTRAPVQGSLYLFAGEQSGDLLGGNLVQALKKASPSTQMYGVGGQKMVQAGMQLSHSMERFQVMGFAAVIKSLPRLASDFRKIKREILEKRPAGVVLIDYPDFNMRLAASLRKSGYRGKLIHYVCPSVWAWRKYRVKGLVKTLDHLLAILPFETRCFTHTNLAVSYVGHPLVKVIDSHTYDPTFQLPGPLIALFPGSRPHEIELNLPIQFKAAQQLIADYQLAVSVARPSLEPLIRSIVGEKTLLVPAEKRYELMRVASGAIATSGTIILELGFHSVPTVATYQLSAFIFMMRKYVAPLPFYTLVNIICGKEVYPEFIHKELPVDKIAQSLKKIMANPAPCKEECARLRSLLDQHDASQKAAQIILKELHALPLP